MRGDNDTLLDALEKAGPYFDAGWKPENGIRPSLVMGIRYCEMMSRGNDDAEIEAASLAQFWLHEGRARWRAGFSANPLTTDPMPRSINQGKVE